MESYNTAHIRIASLHVRSNAAECAVYCASDFLLDEQCSRYCATHRASDALYMPQHPTPRRVTVLACAAVLALR